MSKVVFCVCFLYSAEVRCEIDVDSAAGNVTVKIVLYCAVL